MIAIISMENGSPRQVQFTLNFRSEEEFRSYIKRNASVKWGHLFEADGKLVISIFNA